MHILEFPNSDFWLALALLALTLLVVGFAERYPRPSKSKPKDREKGFVLILIVAAMVVLCGFAGLVFDVGYGAYIRRTAQSAADAGARAAALELNAGHSSSQILAAVKQDTANNGFTDGTAGVSVTVNQPPSQGQYAGDNSYVEVQVSKAIPTVFMGMLGAPRMNIGARAVGGKGPGTACVYVLNPSASQALTVSGSGAINASCGIFVNSNASNGLDVSGGACVTASQVQVVGGVNNSSSCGIHPAPQTGVDSQTDPLSYVSAPLYGGCTFTGTVTAANGQWLSPGVYCGGIKVQGGATAYFNPGTYILLGGLDVSGGSSVIGSQVTFYNTQNASYSYKPIVVSGASTTNLSAPTSGLLEGILFFQDRAISNSSQNTISGGSGATFTGALYFPSTPLVYSGGSTTPAGPYLLIVANTLTVSGASGLGSDYSSLQDGDPIKSGAVLAE